MYKTYRASNAEEALGLSGDNVGRTVKDVLAHGFQQSVASVAFFSAQAVHNHIDTLGCDPEKVQLESGYKSALDFQLPNSLSDFIDVVCSVDEVIDQSGGGQSFVLTLGAHTEDGHIRDGTCQLNDGLTLLMKKKTELSSHSCNNNDEHFES